MLFDEALDAAHVLTKGIGTSLAEDITLVRDVHGRIRTILPRKPEERLMLPLGSDIEISELDFYAGSLSRVLGAYGFSAENAVLFKNELSIDDALWNERRLYSDENGLKIYLLDRQIIGQDWMKNVLPRTSKNPRFTFFGIKGGVGRSTALVNWAWHLASQGKKVLIFDLDLESPGVSSSLLPIENLPDFGIVDWFVEDGVGQGDCVLSEMLGTSPLAQGTAGEIIVVPAYGSKTENYLPKLARCYAQLAGKASQPESWAERLQRLVETLEETTNADVVILDSRAGLHDIAAVAVTRMDADTFLFAIDSPQTWRGYALLFQHWKSHPALATFRPRLQIVAAMVPDTYRDDYLQSFKENSWNLFGESLYEEAEAEDLEAFNFDLDAEFAPHSPIPVFWQRALQQFNPVVGGIDVQTANEVYGKFYLQADQMFLAQQKDVE